MILTGISKLSNRLNKRDLDKFILILVCFENINKKNNITVATKIRKYLLDSNFARIIRNLNFKFIDNER